MKERLFLKDEEIDLKKLEEKINEEVRDDIVNHEDDVNTEKWFMYPVIYLEKEEVIAKIKEFVELVDDTYLTNLEKIGLILTLIYLVEKVRFDITNIDINNIYLLVSYLNNESIENLGDRLLQVNDDEMLYKVRCFSLDLEIRTKLLDYILKNDISKEDVMKMIVNNDYYQVLEIIK